METRVRLERAARADQGEGSPPRARAGWTDAYPGGHNKAASVNRSAANRPPPAKPARERTGKAGVAAARGECWRGGASRVCAMSGEAANRSSSLERLERPDRVVYCRLARILRR